MTWAIMRSNEDGRHFRLMRSEGELERLLARPQDHGISRFETLDQLNEDPAYWPREVAVLLRVDAILPLAVMGYTLPEWVEQ
jgi:hypothetical protein